MSVSIVIPNWNGRHLLEKHLPSVIRAKDNKANKIKEIIVVDDASQDDSLVYLESLLKDKEIRLIKQSENKGFSKTVNHGVRMARGELVCLLNTDVSVSDNFLSSAIPLFSDKKVFAVSFNEGKYGAAKGKYERGYIVHEGKSASNKIENTFWVSGGSGVFRRSVWKKLKGLDAELFSPFYHEDVDISYRALKRGYKLLWDHNAKVDHQHESVINVGNFRKRKMILIKERNILTFNWKNLTSKKLFRKHIAAILKRALRHPGYWIVIFMALKKYRYIKKVRKIELKESTVSDEAIFAKFQS